jgi:hypothetical protein
LKRQDKLSTTGYGYVKDEEDPSSPLVAVPIPAEQKLKEHEGREEHGVNMKRSSKVAMVAAPAEKVVKSITFEDELYARTVRSVHLIVVRELSLNDMYHLLELQNANGAIVSFDHSNPHGGVEEAGVKAFLAAGAGVFMKHMRQRAMNPLVAALFPRGTPFGGMGDGSSDRSLTEQEAVVLRFLGPNGRPFNTFTDLAELDLSTSHDGRSPDSQCIATCYSKSFDALNQFPNFLNHSDWKKAAVGFSFDGASVMLGTQNGAASKLKAMCESDVVVTHAVAHVEQLVIKDAFAEVDYYEEWKGIMQEVYLFYHLSGKKRHALEEVAKELSESLLKIGGTHGIRWAASQARSIRALLTDLPSIVVDLEVTVKTALGMNFTALTPSNSFLKKSFFQKFDAGGGRTSRWKAIVDSIVPSPDGISANDKFTLKYSNKSTLEMPKAELVQHLTTDADHDRLEGDDRWQLRLKVVTWRFSAFSAFMLDVHDQLAILSKSFQSNSLLIFDVGKNVNKTLRALKKLLDTPGENEKKFWIEVKKDDSADVLRTCHLSDGEEGRIAFKNDRKQVIDGLDSHLIQRYLKVLENNVLKSMTAFDHRHWPPAGSLEGANDGQIEDLYEAFKSFFDESETKAIVVEQWNDMQSMIASSPGLIARGYHDLWSHILIHFHSQYPLPLRLVAISLLIPGDTSECERIFSLMNDIKTPERSSMGSETLKHLMGVFHRFKSSNQSAMI